MAAERMKTMRMRLVHSDAAAEVDASSLVGITGRRVRGAADIVGGYVVWVIGSVCAGWLILYVLFCFKTAVSSW